MKAPVPLPGRLGFSLMEILLALLVVSIGIMAMTGLLGTSLDTAAKSSGDLDAVGFADLVLNHCHAADFNDIPASGTMTIPGYDADPLDIQVGSVARFEGPGYAASYLLNLVEPAPDILALSLKVWPGYGTNGTPRIFYTEIYNWVKK